MTRPRPIMVRILPVRNLEKLTTTLPILSPRPALSNNLFSAPTNNKPGLSMPPLN